MEETLKSNGIVFFPLPYNKIYYPTYGGPFCIANDVIRSSES